MRNHTIPVTTLKPTGRRRHRERLTHRRTATPALPPRRNRPAHLRTQPVTSAHAAHDPITLAAATWLACGIVLLGLTPLPMRDATLGWSPAFWLLAAPAILLLARCISTLLHHAEAPLRFASIRRNNSAMMRR